MNGIRLVMAAGIRNIMRLKVSFLILFSVTFICVVGVALIFCLQFIGPESKSAAPDIASLESYLGLVIYVISFMCVGITLNAYGFQTMVKEKARGNLQSLLATPLKVTDIWIGKALSVFVPGLIFAVLISLLALIIINLIYFVPVVGFVVNPWIIISSFVAVPLVYLSMGLLVHLVGLTSRTANGNVIAQVFLPVMVSVMINLMVRYILDASTWLFTVVNLGLAIVIFCIVLAFRSRLSSEKIILSG